MLPPLLVVSYRNSTSNHNHRGLSCLREAVVSYRNSTSNHNPCTAFTPAFTLYLIEILHQTTTRNNNQKQFRSCILSKFYIKPQQRFDVDIPNPVVSYRNSTSNHNPRPIYSYWVQVVSYRNSTSNHNFGPGDL